MHDVKVLRPKLTAFRVVAIDAENRNEAAGERWVLEVTEEIQVGLAVPTVPGGMLQAHVKLELKAKAHAEQNPNNAASFCAEYMGKFNYLPEVTEELLSPLFGDEAYQYGLVSQVYPLAMSHFCRELQATGFDARGLALGL